MGGGGRIRGETFFHQVGHAVDVYKRQELESPPSRVWAVLEYWTLVTSTLVLPVMVVTALWAEVLDVYKRQPLFHTGGYRRQMPDHLCLTRHHSPFKAFHPPK